MTLRISLSRAARILVAGMLLATAFSATAVAKPPKYGGDVIETPDTFVSYGKLVRFDVTWINQSGANIPHVFVTADNTTGGTFVALVAGPSQGTCGTQTPTLFKCSFDAVNSGASVTFSVVYRAPSSGSSYSQKFLFTAQGATSSDGGTSRGDDMPLFGLIGLRSGTAEDGGGYIFGADDFVQTNQTLNKKNNPQSEKLDFSGSTEENFGATVSEAATTSCPTGITTCYGNLVIMNAKSGFPIAGGFLATVGYTSVPGSATGSFIHWLHDTATGDVEGVDYEIIDQSCADVTSGTPCISDSFKTSGNTFYVIQLYENGPMRGI